MTRSNCSRTFRALAVTTALLCVTACGAIGNPLAVLTEKPPVPDEFSVLSRKPLQMPSSVALPEPRLGERSALEPDPNTDAIVALLGSSAVSRVQTASAGEGALLTAANAAAEQTEIRRILESETRAAEEDKPYEAPSLFDLFGDDGEKQNSEDLINPASEARRLQSEGVAAAPIDPSDVPEEAVDATTDPDDEIIFHPKRGILRKN